MAIRAKQPISADAVHKPQRKHPGMQNAELYVILVIAGAALLLFMRTKETNGLHTGALISLQPGSGEDIAIVQNMTNTVVSMGNPHNLHSGPPVAQVGDYNIATY